MSEILNRHLDNVTFYFDKLATTIKDNNLRVVQQIYKSIGNRSNAMAQSSSSEDEVSHIYANRSKI